MLLSQSVWRDFLSCCENIMAQIHCKYSTQSVVPVARKYLHVFALGRSLTACTEHFAMMTVTEQSAPLYCYDLCTVFMSETVFLCFPRIFQSLRLLNTMCACVLMTDRSPTAYWHRNPQKDHFPCDAMYHIRANSARNANNTWKQRVHLIT